MESIDIYQALNMPTMEVEPLKQNNAFENNVLNFEEQMDNSQLKASNLLTTDMKGRVSKGALEEGVDAMDGMFDIIQEAAKATGSASNADRNISKDDVLKMNNWIQDNRQKEWTVLHGDDEGGKATGFHRVQGDGGAFDYQGDQFVNTVLDGINHLGFDFNGKNFLNEDGNANANLQDMTDWVNTALFGDFESGITIGDRTAKAVEAVKEAVEAQDDKIEESTGVVGSSQAFDMWASLMSIFLEMTFNDLQEYLEEEGAINPDGTINYDKLVDALVAKGLSPEAASASATKLVKGMISEGLGMKPEGLDAYLKEEGSLNTDGTLNTDKLVKKLESDGMTKEVASTEATKAATSFNAMVGTASEK